MLTVTETFIILMVLYVSFSMGAFLKLLQFRMSTFMTLIIAFLIPPLLLKASITATFRSILTEGLKDGMSTLGFCIVTFPLYVRVVGEVSAELYAKQIAKKRIYEKYNIVQRPQDIILFKVGFPAVKEIVSGLTKNLIEDKHNGYKIY